ncbi:MAG: hypothetical protein K2H82_01425 [Oscillospiraceae bacterium]|nr:hypothetical protein [Oscillospiraceae bacterium]
MYEFIPKELKKLKNWVCWQGVPNKDGHITKVPINPNDGHKAESNNPETWADFDTAERVSRDYAGIGFMFGGSGYFGVDLDDMDDALKACENGDFDNIIGEFVNALDSYTEWSQSAKGIHIICKGKLPPGGRRKKPVEMYDSGRFFVMSGNAISDCVTIPDRTEEIKPLHAKYLGAAENCEEPDNQLRLSEIPEIPEIHDNPGLTVQEIIAKAMQNEKFAKLYSGDFSAYPSQSEADMAFCSMLAFWCAKDRSKMDEIYRSSGLMRPKWDRKQSGSTYGALTLQKAADTCTECYKPGNAGMTITDRSLTIGGKSAPSDPNPEMPSAKARPAGKMYKFDDTGNAERLFDMYGEIFRYFYTEHKYLYYINGKWHFDNIGYERRIADAVINAMENDVNLYADDEKILKQFQKHVTKSRNFIPKTNMLKEAQHYAPVLPEMLDRNKTIIGVRNGILDLRTGKLKPHDKNAFLTKQIALDYHPDAPKPALWLKFLDDIFQSDQELIRYIQKAIGYSLTGSTQEQCAFFLYGTGNNGKSTFLELIRSIMGDYANNIQPETIMVKQKAGNAQTSDIARLKGARMVTSSETNENVRLNEALLKQMTGGDIMTVRKLYCEEFEFSPEFKIWMATNHKPVIRGTDTGIWRRVHMIPFNACIPANKVDKRLKYKLAKESGQIFKWMADGCLLWQEEGLEMPKVVYDAVKEYRREMDVIGTFLSACCTTGSGEVKASQLYAVYAKWCSENGEYCFPNSKFGQEISKNFQKTRKKDAVYYTGLSLHEEYKTITIG